MCGRYIMCVTGEVFTGYCEGYFGRDSYEYKRVEAEGADWILCRDERGHIRLATFSTGDEKVGAINRWRAEDGQIKSTL